MKNLLLGVLCSNNEEMVQLCLRSAKINLEDPSHQDGTFHREHIACLGGFNIFPMYSDIVCSICSGDYRISRPMAFGFQRLKALISAPLLYNGAIK